jgi:hypothetical protein
MYLLYGWMEASPRYSIVHASTLLRSCINGKEQLHRVSQTDCGVCGRVFYYVASGGGHLHATLRTGRIEPANRQLIACATTLQSHRMGDRKL